MPCFKTAMTFVILRIGGQLMTMGGVGKIKFHIFSKVRLVPLERKDVIPFLSQDLICNFILTPHSINGDDVSLYIKPGQHLWNGCDFIAFFRDFLLPQNNEITAIPKMLTWLDVK